MPHRASKTDKAFAVLWMILLLAGPGFKMSAKVTGWPDFSRRAVEENRNLAAKPHFKTLPAREWGRAVDAWYDDHFAWRADTIELYKSFRFNVAKCPIDQQVPGWNGMIFRRGGTWPEMDDYIGAIRLDDAMLRDWRTLVEGRVAWAEAHGSHYIEAIAPVKAQVHPEYAPFTVRKMPGLSSRQQLAKAMEGSFAETNVIFFTDEFRAEARSGRTMFYKDDHHVSPYGCWMLYRTIVERLRDLWFPQLSATPYYDDPPEDVKSGCAFGAYTNPETDRLEVSSPGYAPRAVPEIGIPGKSTRYPQSPVFVGRPGDGLYIAMRHDSLMRFPLASWRRRGWPELAIPLGDGFSDVAMFIFGRLSTDEMERLFGPRVPDVLLEEIPECKIALGVFGLDDTIRRAAEFGRSQTPAGPDDRRVLALAVFGNVKRVAGDSAIVAELVDGAGRVVASEPVSMGVRRAVFFGTVEGVPPFAARLAGGLASSVELRLRSSGDCEAK